MLVQVILCLLPSQGNHMEYLQIMLTLIALSTSRLFSGRFFASQVVNWSHLINVGAVKGTIARDSQTRQKMLGENLPSDCK